MNRLTYKNPNGTWGMNNGFNMSKVPSELYGALYKLKDYEETGMSPEQLEEIDRLYLEKCEEVNRLRAELEEKEWIPVDERLPEDKQQVLITNWDHSVFLARYDENEERFYNNFTLPLILAWQPLPEPYKESEE